MAVSASETAVSTTVLQAERDQHEAGFLPAIFQGLPAPRQKLPEISPTFKADAVRLHVSREKDKEIALGRSRMGRYEGRSAGRLRASSQGGGRAKPTPHRGAMTPPQKTKTPLRPPLVFSSYRCRSRASSRAFFALAFEVALRVTAPSVMRNGSPVTRWAPLPARRRVQP